MNIYEIYITVVKQGGFTAAAKKLHRSPSSISKKMSLLEERLNVQLFDRTTRNLEITEAGKLYYQRCLDIAQRIADAEKELCGLSEKPAGSITITWPNALSSSGLTEVLGKFCATYPDIKVDVIVDNNQVNLIDQKIDFAFRLDPTVDSSMIAIELFRIAPVVCASPEYLERFNEPQSIDDLAKMPLLLLNNPSAIQKFWKSLPGLKNLDLEEHNRVSDINALYYMAKQGLGVTLMFRHMIDDALSTGQLVELLPEHDWPSQPVYLMFHKSNYVTEKIRTFLAYFKEHYLR